MIGSTESSEERLVSSQQGHEEDGVEIPLSSFVENLESSTGEESSNRSFRFRYAVILSFFLVLAAVGTGMGIGLSKGSTGHENIISAISDNDHDNGNPLENTSAGDEDDSIKLDIAGEIEGLITSGIDNSTNNTDSEGNYIDPIFDILMQNAVFGGIEFQDPASYQSKAAKWVGKASTTDMVSTERILQRYALACLYYATNGVRTKWSDESFGFGVVKPWIEESGWLDFNNECEWYQVDCDEKGKVISIMLHQNKLSGSLPSELALLKDSLETIDVYDNPIYNAGDEGHAWLGELGNLKRLYYARTYFEYNNGIPTVIRMLTQLEEYDCSYTLYQGSLRGEVFANTLSLNYLSIGGNHFNNSIPSELATLPYLEFMYAEDTGLTGDLSFITEMPVIAELWIDRNYKMRGSIPPSIGEVTTLRSLSIANVGLTGTLPTELGLLPLKQFWVHSNGGLRGSIPTELGGLSSLSRLSIAKTSLTGTMPNEVCANAFPNGELRLEEADCHLDDRVASCTCCTCQ